MDQALAGKAADEAVHQVRHFGKPWGVAITLAADAFGLSTAEVNAELRKRRAAKWSGPASPCCGRPGRRIKSAGCGMSEYECRCKRRYVR